jgi:general secretion pathway protein M
VSALKQKLQPMMAALQTAWRQRTPRERQLLGTATVVLMLFLLWNVAIAPALRTWREAPARQTVLDAQTRKMQALQAQVQALKKPSVITRVEAIQWLEASIPQSLGKDAKWSLQGERLSLILLGTSAEQLASWLVQAREQAQALPVQAQLQQTPLPTDVTKISAAGPSTVRLSGTLLLSLP